MTAMDINEVINKLGNWHGWGRWQMRTYFVIGIAFGFISTWQLFVITFIGGSPDSYHCNYPLNNTMNESIPFEIDPQTKQSVRSGCNMYRENTSTIVPCQNGWKYYSKDFINTMVTDWDLVCDRSTWIANSQTIFTVGVALGASVTTSLADRFGRKKIFFITVFMISGFGALMAASPHYAVFCVCQFLTGFFQQGMALSGFILCNELLPASERERVTSLFFFFWCFGMMLLSLWAYFIRSWRYLQLTISLPGFLILTYAYFCPESPLWLYANNRKDEAEKILRKAAKENGVMLPEKFLKEPEITADENPGCGELCREFRLMLKSRRCVTNMVVMLFIWLANQLVYFSIALLSGTDLLPGNRYINFLINGVVEFPSAFICLIAMPIFGKRVPIFLFHLIAGLALTTMTVFYALSPTLQAQGLNTSLAILICTMVGKFGVTGAYTGLVLYGMEIYPTKLRSIGLGLTATCGVVGGVMAPYMVFFVARYYPMWITGAVFSAMSIIAAFSGLFIPDTQGFPLPSTVKEIESWPLIWGCPSEKEKAAIKRLQNPGVYDEYEPDFGEDKKTNLGYKPYGVTPANSYANPAFVGDHLHPEMNSNGSAHPGDFTKL